MNIIIIIAEIVSALMLFSQRYTDHKIICVCERRHCEIIFANGSISQFFA